MYICCYSMLFYYVYISDDSGFCIKNLSTTALNENPNMTHLIFKLHFRAVFFCATGSAVGLQLEDNNTGNIRDWQVFYQRSPFTFSTGSFVMSLFQLEVHEFLLPFGPRCYINILQNFFWRMPEFQFFVGR